MADTIELTEYLRARFDEEKIYLLGESWGSTLGVLAVQRRPDLYHAWIGSGQMVSQRETDRRLYRDVLALAERTGDSALAAKMRGYGEPPYADTPYANAFVMGHYEALYKPYTPPQAYMQIGSTANVGPWGILASEYNLVEHANVLRGLIDDVHGNVPAASGAGLPPRYYSPGRAGLHPGRRGRTGRPPRSGVGVVQSTPGAEQAHLLLL